MNNKIKIRLLLTITVLCLLFFNIHAYSQYTIHYSWIKPGIPDVNKPDLDPNTEGWQKDNSCLSPRQQTSSGLQKSYSNSLFLCL